MMSTREAAAAVKASVTAEQAAVILYGIQVDRHHYAVCPFHGEKTGSLRFFQDGGFKCFGCGASGSVIDFVMQMDSLRLRPAVEKLNDAFHLGLDLGRGDLIGRMQADARDARTRATREELVAAWHGVRDALSAKQVCLDLLCMEAEKIPPEQRTGALAEALPLWRDELFQLYCDLIDVDAQIARVRRWPGVSAGG